MAPLFLHINHLQRGGDVDAVADGAGGGAEVGVEAEDALGHFLFVRLNLQLVAHMDAPHHQCLAI